MIQCLCQFIVCIAGPWICCDGLPIFFYAFLVILPI